LKRFKKISKQEFYGATISFASTVSYNLRIKLIFLLRRIKNIFTRWI